MNKNIAIKLVVVDFSVLSFFPFFFFVPSLLQKKERINLLSFGQNKTQTIFTTEQSISNQSIEQTVGKNINFIQKEITTSTYFLLFLLMQNSIVSLLHATLISICTIYGFFSNENNIHHFSIYSSEQKDCTYLCRSPNQPTNQLFIKNSNHSTTINRKQNN